LKSEDALVRTEADATVPGAPPGPDSGSLADLYVSDETAWLERMSRLVADRRLDELDYDHLSEFLSDMARRDRREVVSRLTSLLMHLLKWEHQPSKRTRSWLVTIQEQRDELLDLIGGGVLRQHAEGSLAEVYRRAVKRASQESGIDPGSFPIACPWRLDEALERDLTP
jgi:hypothetical protein